MALASSKIQIRDNSRIILGLTGLIGSGCTTLSNTLAFDFVPRLKRYISSFDESSVSGTFKNINSLKTVQEDLACDKNLVEENVKLKKVLEEREVINILKRNESILTKNNFLYISFSSMIMFYVVKHILECPDLVLQKTVKKVIEDLGFNIEEASKLTNDFFKKKKFHEIKKDKDKKERLIALISKFHIIREEIVKSSGREKLQDLGDNVRRFGNPFPQEATKQRQIFTGRWLASIVDRYIQLRSECKYFVVECFRNPQELYYFREKYSFFYLVALSATRDLRLQRSGLSEKEFEKVDLREFEPQHNEDICELDVGKCIDVADIVVKNNNSLDELFNKLLRYTAIILEPGSIKPSEEETLMHVAYTLSVRSNCLSRQVGAVITNNDGYIIGGGWNDVGEGQLSCGIKLGKDYSNEYIKNNSIEINENEKELYICIKKKIAGTSDNKEKKIGESEFCPVLHAEENAILQLAKYHSGEIKDGIMYTTTFPCTACLRKISQVGINTIIFTESYINPLVQVYIKQSIKNIRLVAFEGVKSHSYFRLFKPYYNKKEQQQYLK